MWLFGYGSLIWKPEPRSKSENVGYIEGYARRFYQGSPDHRGTPDAPGRVLTLVESPGNMLWGKLFEIPEDRRDEFMEQLDHREKAGYEKHWLPVYADPLKASRVVDEALVYIGGPANPDFIGGAPLSEMAAHIARSEGPSGRNTEYLLNVDRALRAHGVHEPHIRELADGVRSTLRHRVPR